MNRTIVDMWVGIFVVAGLGAILLLALRVGNASATFNVSDTYSVYADFENIGGLKVRAPVKSAGVVVGRVANIQLNSQTYKARAELAIDKRYQFPADTSAAILTAGLLGEQYIGFDAGGDVENLKQGSVLQITQSAIVLEKLISQFLYNKAAEGGSSDKAAEAK
ncbi:MAG: outer membrane lipid asymmetry maintenance protein MlaD [Betaproteobacteria bacterium]|jgi:phospholipid/cholesterol/gamma-HCH transport system substrate-binding protein|nr:outer membrane lipid asymmetry maintenance protein MlaD [Betaproteobacteria bacterium]NBS92272.1 outer membrane lipid asymmetry maintenance protein MlaD [Betaproteobacteria bacterium]NBT05663.1 outer membrane lipid asymmetry maintenance protein MlaD [Betaproteobacteria bacterium]NBU12208.1 outer membrane lipid asymmetry maintenance protein MlaD [Betaproteobacteria bacterium]NBY52499.1 outer membrane lipid asymmetry maintenance protein MlaD [Betaproteobacteria bacterium]